ncbi:lysine transporter LysE [Deinococcus piscis]|uniref:Lysine transporter LysE n=1 Tax=Deinococcus piscis TaxID=394230 RepID=A0ABQ3K3J8_9DEIO|nr:LysE family translocator [Deinococcus piscis]GHG00607.1 lysine transporter LysE [Deinococcus piscis]
MADLSIMATFAVAVLVAIAVPGPDALLVLGNTLSHGKRGGVLTALGVCLGYGVHILAALLGLTAIVLASATLFGAVKLIGAAYLMYLGIQTWRQRGHLELGDAERPHRTPWQLLQQGFLGNALNPKAVLFFMAVLPQFVRPEQGQVTLQIVQLGLVNFVVSLLFYSLLAQVAEHIRLGLQQRPVMAGRIQKALGGLLVGLGASLLLTKRPAA